MALVALADDMSAGGELADQAFPREEGLRSEAGPRQHMDGGEGVEESGRGGNHPVTE